MKNPYIDDDRDREGHEDHRDHNALRPIFKRIGIYMPFLLILGLLTPILVFVSMMQGNGWKVPDLGVRGVFARATQTGKRVYVYVSPSTQAYFVKIGGNYETLLVPWRNYFKDRGLDYTELSDIKSLGEAAIGVLILPSALALGDTERDVILGFRAKGGGILTTWATGTRNGSGEWAGWQFLESLGAKVTGEVPPDSEARHLTLTGESPLSHQQPAGARIWMGKTTENLLRMTGESVAGRFMTWPRIPDDEHRTEGGIVFSETGSDQGRTACFAFSETSWESRPVVPYQVIDDTLQWLQRLPVVVRAAWPDGKLAAQIIEMDTEQGFENATAFGAMMRSISYKPTFYVLTSVAAQFPLVTQALAREFEIAYHGDVHVSFKDQPANTQEQRLQNMMTELHTVLPDAKNITGFRAPTEGYDTITEQLLQKRGIRHHAADPSRLEGRTPAVVKMDDVLPDDALIVLPRTQRDDINLYWEKLDIPRTTKALSDDFDLAVNTGSLGFLSVHSQNFGEASVLRQAMPDFLAHVQERRSQVWMATSAQVAQWWRDRERLRLSSFNVGRRLDFNLSVKGTQPLFGATLVVMLPRKGQLPTVRSTKIGTMIPRVTKIDDYRAAVVFDSLKPGDYVFQATFTE